MFRYKSLKWQTPIGTGGKPHGPATAGVNAGNRQSDSNVAGFNVTNHSNNITDLVSMSNVGVAGLFVYPLN